MIRWLAIIIVIINVGYFAWLQSDTDGAINPAPMVEAVDGSVKKLELLVSGGTRKAVDMTLLRSSEAGECWLIGPFDELLSVQQVKGRLAALSIEFPIKEVEVNSGEDYWVHIAPQKNRQEAVKLLRELQGKGIDSFLITEGELAQGISLGLFSQLARAQAVFEERKSQGYDAILKSVPRTHIQFWGLYNGEKYGALADELWRKINQGNSVLKRHKKSCNSVASMGEFD
jgi:hypothetical protein